MLQAQLIRRGLLLEYLTLGWNVVGVIIVVAAAYMARSVALAGFGLDSLIEIFASIIVVWQLLGVNQHYCDSAHTDASGSFDCRHCVAGCDVHCYASTRLWKTGDRQATR